MAAKRFEKGARQGEAKQGDSEGKKELGKRKVERGVGRAWVKVGNKKMKKDDCGTKRAREKWEKVEENTEKA